MEGTSQWPPRLRRRTAVARLLKLWVRIPLKVWMSVVTVILSGRGLYDELITRPEESYRLWCVVVCDLETSWMRRSWPTGGLSHQKLRGCGSGRGPILELMTVNNNKYFQSGLLVPYTSFKPLISWIKIQRNFRYINYFSNCNFSKHELMGSLKMVWLRRNMSELF